jgi:YhcH/YjgK/YiaL family protein
MILDTLAQAAAYDSLNPRFARAFAFLRSIRTDTPVGRHEIDGEEIYALVQRHSTRPVAEKKLEVHRRYIDIQFIVRGREIIAWTPLATLGEPSMAFDAKVDAALYPYPPAAIPVGVLPGQFMILFPEDAHAPSCVWEEAAEVLKVVVKVQV